MWPFTKKSSRASERKYELDIVFNADGVGFGTHGYIQAKNPNVGIHKFCRVRFAFVGMTQPPKLDERILSELFNAARNQGYEVEHLISYGLSSQVKPVRNIPSILSEDRKIAENGRYRSSEILAEHSVK